jgi:hypothetical protein
MDASGNSETCAPKRGRKMADDDFDYTAEEIYTVNPDEDLQQLRFSAQEAEEDFDRLHEAVIEIISARFDDESTPEHIIWSYRMMLLAHYSALASIGRDDDLRHTHYFVRKVLDIAKDALDESLDSKTIQ